MTERPNNSAPPHDIQTEPGFERFVRDTQARLRGFVRSKGLSPQDADDLAQEAYLTLWKRRADAKNPQTFLLGIAKTLVQAHHRKSIRLDAVSLDEQTHDVPSPQRTPDVEGPAATIAPLLAHGLGQLTRRQREVLELVWLQNHSRPQAAAILGISQSTLRSHEQEAFRTLRKSTEN